MQTLMTLVTDSESGLQAILKCSSLKTDYDEFYKAMCKSAMPNLFQLGFIVFFVSMVNIVAASVGSCIAIRFREDTEEPEDVGSDMELSKRPGEQLEDISEVSRNIEESKAVGLH